MENIIKQVIESEYRAQKIIEEAEKERSLAASNINNDLQRIKDEIYLSARQKGQEIRERKLVNAKAQADEIMAEANKKAELMKNKFTENRDSWVKNLLNYILSIND